MLVGPFEFLEWTADNHLAHSKFVGREDKDAKDLERELGLPSDLVISAVRHIAHLSRCGGYVTFRSPTPSHRWRDE